MLEAFLSHIKKEKLFSPSEKILLTVSGGIDSVVMCELFRMADLNCGIAHCNFQLRGEESGDDESFVETLAEKYSVPFHTITFNTKSYAKKNKLSTQIAARQLRYQWFEEIREQFNYDHIATAHHLDDSTETFFINLIRGTGISGLHGILPKQGKIIRPLLFLTKEEISNFAKTNKLKHREDSSNSTDAYLRNKIRHKVIPILKEMNPTIDKTITGDIQRLRDAERIYKKEIESQRKKLIKKGKNCFSISIDELKKLDPLSTYLYEFLKPFNFNISVVNEIIDSLHSLPGKQFFSDSYRIVKDREQLFIEEKKKAETENLNSKLTKFAIKKTQPEYRINGGPLLRFHSEINHPKFKIPRSGAIACLDIAKLQFPLEIRKWESGDHFYPLGMKGKKLLSDFFIDTKLSIIEKENTWLLTSKGLIVWIIGLRIDERFKITDNTKKIYFAEIV